MVYLSEFRLSYSGNSDRKEYLFIILTVDLRFSNTARGSRTRKKYMKYRNKKHDLEVLA